MAYIAELAARPDQLAQVGHQVVAAVLLLDARRPVVLAGAHKHMLRVVGDEAVQRRLVVDLMAGQRFGRRGAGACRRWAGGRRWERRWFRGERPPSWGGQGSKSSSSRPSACCSGKELGYRHGGRHCEGHLD